MAHTSHRPSFLCLTVLIATLFGASCGGGAPAAGPDNNVTPVQLGSCTRVEYSAPSGASNNIVFTFDKAYTCGQFANGDWWVSKGSNPFVTITSISPSASGGRNGFEANPSSHTEQAFDDRAAVTYKASLMPNLPLQVVGVTSVVKAVSKTGPVGFGPLQFVAILTVVDEPIANSAEVFRPGYFGTAKTFFNTAQIRSGLIPKYAATALPAVSAFPISAVASRYRNVQMDHHFYFSGRSTHPADNMPGDADYGAAMARDNAVHLLRLLLNDFDFTNPAHKQALINYLQMAVDLQGMAAQGMKWFADGGHPHGRKLPLVFGAWVLGSADFTSAMAAVGGEFGEDNTLWRSPSGTALFGAAGTEAQYWSTTRGLGGSKIIRDPYGLIDGGGFEVGEAYQFCCTSKPWQYTTLALYMLGLEDAWGADRVMIDYVERWVSSGARTLPDNCAPYDGVSANYGVTYGPNGSGGCIFDTDPSDGIGRWPTKNQINANSGTYASDFGEQLWAWYKALH